MVLSGRGMAMLLRWLLVNRPEILVRDPAFGDAARSRYGLPDSALHRHLVVPRRPVGHPPAIPDPGRLPCTAHPSLRTRPRSPHQTPGDRRSTAHREEPGRRPLSRTHEHPGSGAHGPDSERPRATLEGADCRPCREVAVAGPTTRCSRWSWPLAGHRLTRLRMRSVLHSGITGSYVDDSPERHVNGRWTSIEHMY